MLLTIYNSKPISTGWFVANCLLAGISDGCGWLLKWCGSINTCSHFNFITQRYHDHWMGFIYASTTLMLEIMIRKSVSMPLQRWLCHMVTLLLYDDFQTHILDGKLEVTLKDHPPDWTSHLESAAQKHKDLNYEESTCYELQRHLQRLNAMIQHLFSRVTSLRGRLLGIRLFHWRLGHPKYYLAYCSS